MLSHEFCPQISITSRLFSFFLCQVYLLTSDLFVDSVSSSVIWLNVRCGVAEERSVVDDGRPETGK